MIPISQVKNGVAAYADREIIANLPVGTFKRVAVGAAVALVLARGEALVAPYLAGDVIRGIGISDGTGIDLEAVCEAVKGQIPDSGMKINLPVVNIDLTFRAADIDTLKHDIEGARP